MVRAPFVIQEIQTSSSRHIRVSLRTLPDESSPQMSVYQMLVTLFPENLPDGPFSFLVFLVYVDRRNPNRPQVENFEIKGEVLALKEDHLLIFCSTPSRKVVQLLQRLSELKEKGKVRYDVYDLSQPEHFLRLRSYKKRLRILNYEVVEAYVSTIWFLGCEQIEKLLELIEKSKGSWLDEARRLFRTYNPHRVPPNATAATQRLPGSVTAASNNYRLTIDSQQLTPGAGAVSQPSGAPASAPQKSNTLQWVVLLVVCFLTVMMVVQLLVIARLLGRKSKA
jgi:hypothetical protein